MVNTRAGGAPADAEGITRAEDEEDGLNEADRSTLYSLQRTTSSRRTFSS